LEVKFEVILSRFMVTLKFTVSFETLAAMVLFAQVRLRGSLTTGMGEADVVMAAARAATTIDTRISISMSTKRCTNEWKAETSF
jgi:hypothetical protein